MGTRPLTVGDFSRAVAHVLSQQAELLGMSQSAIARETGISQTRVNLILRAERAITVEETALICDALGTTVHSVIRAAEAVWDSIEPDGSGDDVVNLFDAPHGHIRNIHGIKRVDAIPAEHLPFLAANNEGIDPKVEAEAFEDNA